MSPRYLQIRCCCVCVCVCVTISPFFSRARAHTHTRTAGPFCAVILRRSFLSPSLYLSISLSLSRWTHTHTHTHTCARKAGLFCSAIPRRSSHTQLTLTPSLSLSLARARARSLSWQDYIVPLTHSLNQLPLSLSLMAGLYCAATRRRSSPACARSTWRSCLLGLFCVHSRALLRA